MLINIYMSQYNLIYPNNKKIYYGNNPKKIARKVFKNLAKNNNVSQQRICLENNNTKKKYHFVGITNKKLNDYENIINSKNLNIYGGGKEIDDKDFLKNISNLTQDLAISIDDLNKIIRQKYDPEKEEKLEDDKKYGQLLNKIDQGIERLDSIDKSLKSCT